MVLPVAGRLWRVQLAPYQAAGLTTVRKAARPATTARPTRVSSGSVAAAARPANGLAATVGIVPGSGPKNGLQGRVARLQQSFVIPHSEVISLLYWTSPQCPFVVSTQMLGPFVQFCSIGITTQIDFLKLTWLLVCNCHCCFHVFFAE